MDDSPGVQEVTPEDEARLIRVTTLLEKWLEQNTCLWPEKPCNYKCNGGCEYWKGFVSI